MSFEVRDFFSKNGLGLFAAFVAAIIFVFMAYSSYVFMLLAWPFLFSYVFVGMLVWNYFVAIVILILGFLLNVLYLFFIGRFVLRVFRAKECSQVCRFVRGLIVVMAVVLLGFAISGFVDGYRLSSDESYAIESCHGGGNCLVNVASSFSDFEVCALIEDESYAAYCYEVMAGRLENESLCFLADDSLLRESRCFTELAFEKRDLGICDGFMSESLVAFCRCHAGGDVFESSWDFPRCGDLRVCEDLEDSDFLDDCFREVAYVSEDVFVCGEISDDDEVDRCYYDVALKIKDLSLCENIKDASWRRGCEEGGFKY